MDEALKARLIGAAVLVALAVLLIPELLSGRGPTASDGATPAGSRGIRTFTIELGGGTPATVAQATSAPVPGVSTAPARSAQPEAVQSSGAVQASAGAEADSAGPGGAGISTAATGTSGPRAAAPSADQGLAAASAPSTRPSTAPALHPAATSAPAAQPPAASSPARGGWSVQVGAFGSTATAAKMADELRSAGYRAYVSPVSRSGKTLNRVRVGPEAERARAEGLAASLKARGLPATVVANE